MRVLKETKPQSRFWVSLAIGAVGLGALWLAFARRKPDPDRLWQLAHEEFDAGHPDRTEAALATLKALRVPTPMDHLLTAQVALFRHNDAQALSDLAAVPDDHSMAPQARLLQGQVELRQGHPHAAETFLKGAVKLDPKLVQAHKELIYIYGILLRRSELQAEFRTLSGLTNLTAEQAFVWCLTRNSTWDAKELTEKLEGYIKFDPADRMSRLALAENYRALGRREDAEKALTALGDSDPDARALRALLALDVGDDVRAEAISKEGPANHPELARLRGRFALALRDGPAAVQYYRAAYEADPDHRDSLFGYGQALMLVGQKEAAAPFVAAARDHDALGTLMQRAAVPASRSDPALLRALGAACERIHRLPEAKAWYRLAIDADPLDPEAQKSLFRIKKGEESKPSDKPVPVDPSAPNATIPAHPLDSR